MAKAASAAGLFRATGKRAKPQPRQRLDGEWEKTEGTVRRADEFYPTPAEPIRAFLHAELPRIRYLGGVVWESSAGDGAIVRELEAVGLTVAASDLVNRGLPGCIVRSFYDFTEWPIRSAPRRVTIGNPPYDQINWRDGKALWLTHTLETLEADYAAYLLSWSWFGAGGLAKVWAKHPPARVYLMRWKIDFTGDGSPPMLNCWVVWEKGHKGPPALLMLDRKDARQQELEL